MLLSSSMFFVNSCTDCIPLSVRHARSFMRHTRQRRRRGDTGAWSKKQPSWTSGTCWTSAPCAEWQQQGRRQLQMQLLCQRIPPRRCPRELHPTTPTMRPGPNRRTSTSLMKRVLERRCPQLGPVYTWTGVCEPGHACRATKAVAAMSLGGHAARTSYATRLTLQPMPLYSAGTVESSKMLSTLHPAPPPLPL